MKTSKGLKKAIKKPELEKNPKWGKIILKILYQEDKPMHGASIMEKIRGMGYDVEDSKIRNVIFYAKGKGYIRAHKIAGVPTFYCLPSWFRKGKLKKKILEIA